MNENLKKERRKRLIDLREKNKLTQNEVAAAAGISKTSYHQLEKGEAERNFSEMIFQKIAKVLNTTPNYIMFGVEEPKIPDFEAQEPFDKNPENIEIIFIKNNLIKMILGVDDISVLRKISVFVTDQKEYATLKKQAEIS
jgi:transcriptional regulator with XRE-family HTH domain